MWKSSMNTNAIFSFSPKEAEKTMSDSDFQEAVVALLQSLDETGKGILSELKHLNELLEEGEDS